jgi:hypothetical protein
MTRLSVAVRVFLVPLTVGAVLLARPVIAADEYPAPAFFLDGLTAESRWSEILSKPGMKAEFPFVGFESTFVALDSMCVDGPMLAIANPRLDTGVRTSAETFRAQAAAAIAGAPAPPPSPRLAAVTATDPPRQVALYYPVRVFKVIDRAPNPERIFLFQKLWPVPVCPAK